MGTLLIGTSGFNYNDWKELFYPKRLPQKKWLAYYAQHYDTVEINATFYRYFARTVFARWRDETSPTFQFTLKGPKEITHVKRLQCIDNDLSRFIDSIQDLKPKLSSLLWQFPYSFKYDNETKENLDAFLQKLAPDIRQAIEFRHKSWFNEDIYALLNRYNAGCVINDSSRFPAVEIVTGNFVYIRFHGPDQLYASAYSLEALKVWANKIKGWLTQFDVYGYFNNDYGGRAIQNSVELIDLVRR